MNATLARLGGGLGRLLRGPDRLEVEVGPDGPTGDFAGALAGGRGVGDDRRPGPALPPSDESSYYLYVVLPEAFRRRAAAASGSRSSTSASATASSACSTPPPTAPRRWDGLYKAAEQRWRPEAVGLRRFRRALFHLPDFDPDRTQNLGASFRLEFRSELLVSRLVASLAPPPDSDAFPAVAPLPELRKMPGRFYPINYLFIEITNACNFKCTWCPDEIMDRRRGFMKKEKVFRLLDEIAEKRAWLGPLYPVKLHQMGEPMLHPDLAEIVAHAEARGVGIELNTNCGLITAERIDALYRAGLTNLILSYQTPDPGSFKTRKAPKLVFDEYRDKVRLAVERKVGPRRAHPHRDRHHEHQVRRRLRASSARTSRPWPSSRTGSGSARSSRSGTGLPRARTTGRRSAASASSTRTRTAAATSSSTASPSSGSAATPGAT